MAENTSIAVFGYASLVNRSSAAETLGRDPGPLLPARLRGWRRRWSQCRDNIAAEKTFAREPGGELPRWVLALNVEPVEDEDAVPAPNGALVEISEQELERLDVRELRYDRLEVTGQIEVADGEGVPFDRVMAYRAKPERFVAEPPPGAVIIAGYLRAIEAGFSDLGPGERELFFETTGPPPVERIEAKLVKDRIPPGNPRQW